MDWGLFDKNAGDNRYLREEIVYSRKVSICYACHIYFVVEHSVYQDTPGSLKVLEFKSFKFNAFKVFENEGHP